MDKDDRKYFEQLIRAIEDLRYSMEDRPDPLTRDEFHRILERDFGPRGPRGARGPSGPEGPKGPSGAGSADSGGGAGAGSGGGRFWEGYLVRYLAGTFVGAVGVLVLLIEAPAFDNGKLLKEIVSHLANDTGIESLASILLVLIALGFAFSYIASAPAYVLHTYRCFLYSDKPSESTWTKVGAATVVVISLIFALAVVVILTEEIALYSWAIVLALFVAGLVACIAPFLTLFGNAEKIRRFYKSLARGRAKAHVPIDPEAAYDPKQHTKRRGRAERIESYRHLREHGNAYLIVILNIVLVCVLSIATSIQEFGLLVCLWVLPAAFGWFVASALENDIRT